MLIVRRRDYTKKLLVVNACNTEKNMKCSVETSIPVTSSWFFRILQ